MTPKSTTPFATARRRAVLFIILIGTVSLFADTTYEGARSIAGPFLGSLGASGLFVGVIAGFGELTGYVVRAASGRIADRSGRSWPIMFVGYTINLASVPLLAIAPGAASAGLLMIAERAGRGARVPIRDAMLSHAATRTGHGWAFGLHEALDQTGATAGPLLVALVLALHHGYRVAFGLLIVPASVALALLAAAARHYPTPRDLAPIAPSITAERLPRAFWLCCLAGALLGAGFPDFALVAYHFGGGSVVPAHWIPVLYALAMLADGGAALWLGRLYDRRGLPLVIIAAALAILAIPFLFLGGLSLCILGALLWGGGLAVQDALMKAVVAPLLVRTAQASGFGIFDMVRGIAWFLGSVLIGFLYDRSLFALVVVAVALQLLALPVLLIVMRQTRSRTT